MIVNSWLCQAWTRQNPTASGPQGNYQMGHQTQAGWHHLSCANVAEGAPATFSTPTTLPYATAVHDVEVLPDGRTAVASLRDSNYLRLISLPQLIETDKVSRAGMSCQD